jgi:hypothetical protein
MKIYYSQFYQDYIFVIGGQPYFFAHSEVYQDALCMVPVSPNHLKNSRMHKREEDKEVIYTCTVKDN